jgi:hypothetical protein
MSRPLCICDDLVMVLLASLAMGGATQGVCSSNCAGYGKLCYSIQALVVN